MRAALSKSGGNASLAADEAVLRKKLQLPESKIRSRARSGALYAYPREKSIRRFKDQIRQRTRRRVPLNTEDLIEGLNPLLRGWGEYYKRAHVRKLFNRLDRWIV